jgi:hypothetical protein
MVADVYPGSHSARSSSAVFLLMDITKFLQYTVIFTWSVCAASYLVMIDASIGEYFSTFRDHPVCARVFLIGKMCPSF